MCVKGGGKEGGRAVLSTEHRFKLAPFLTEVHTFGVPARGFGSELQLVLTCLGILPRTHEAWKLGRGKVLAGVRRIGRCEARCDP